VGIVRRHLTGILAALLLVPAWAGAAPADTSDPNLLARTIGWREVGGVPRRLHFAAAPSVTKVEVRDGWASRYEERVTFISGAYVIFEATRYAYSADVPLQQVLYEDFWGDEDLRSQGLQPHIADAVLGSFGGRATAYYVARGKSATCFSFVSQFGAGSGGVRNLMLSGQDCRPNETISAGELVRDWGFILNGLQVN
jgi:hypothetical protein